MAILGETMTLKIFNTDRIMKKIFIPFVIAATTLSFAACQKESSSPASEDELVSLNFTSANPTTKTVADAVNKTILWETGDKISVAYTVNGNWQNASGDATTDKPAKIYVSNGLDTGGETAVFNISASFKATTAGAHQFYSVYPSSCVKSTDIKYAPSVTMTIPEVQTPAENSFDAAADLMIGKATKTYNSLSDAKEDAIPLLWQRIVSHADITLKGLKGLTENEVITTIVLTADADAKLVGDRWIDIQNGNILGPKTITDANILTINGTNLKINNNNVEFWAAVMPATVKSLNIAVETNKATYTRNIESCNIEFKQNARKGLNVDMSSVERVEKEAPASWIATDLADITATDEVVITMAKNGKVYAMTSDKGTTSNPSAVAVAVENMKLTTTPADNLIWNIVNDNGNLTIHPNGHADKWLYSVAAKTDIKVGTGDSKSFTLDAKSGYLKNGERYLGVFNEQDWRAYKKGNDGTITNIANQTLCFYVKGNPIDNTIPTLSVDQTSKVWAADATDAFVVNVAVNSKGGDWTVTPETLSWATIAVDKAAGTITVTPNGANGTETANEATLTITHASDASLKAEVSLKQNGKGGAASYFVKVTTAPTDWSGTYLIVYETGKVAFDGSLATLDKEKNTVDVTISENKIEATDALMKSVFTIESSSAGNYAIKAANGFYIGRTANSNGLSSGKAKMDHTLSFEKNVLKIESTSGPALKYNSNSGQLRFRYYKSGQKDIQLYKLAN